MPSDLQVSNIKDQANANSAITIASDGQITVNQNNPTLTLGTNTTFPTKVTDRTDFYPLLVASAYPSGYSAYYSTIARSGGDAYASIVVPTGFSSVSDAYLWWISGHAGDSEMQVRWDVSTTGQAVATHTQGLTSMAVVDVSDGWTFRQSILNVGSTHWEDTIQANDILGFNMKHLTTANAYFTGISITWRF